MADKYSSFSDLLKSLKEGVDFIVTANLRPGDIAIIAPHGGGIEGGTSEIAENISGNDYSFYSFSGMRKSMNSELHITSTNFDEPRCVELISKAKRVIAVHGLSDSNSNVFVDVGGRDLVLRDAVVASLKLEGVGCRAVSSGIHAALSPLNICNRGSSNAGVQLEITRSYREILKSNPNEMAKFVAAIRRAITTVVD